MQLCFYWTSSQCEQKNNTLIQASSRSYLSQCETVAYTKWCAGNPWLEVKNTHTQVLPGKQWEGLDGVCEIESVAKLQENWAQFSGPTGECVSSGFWKVLMACPESMIGSNMPSKTASSSVALQPPGAHVLNTIKQSKANSGWNYIYALCHRGRG